jgi:hypothetical protein
MLDPSSNSPAEPTRIERGTKSRVWALSGPHIRRSSDMDRRLLTAAALVVAFALSPAPAGAQNQAAQSAQGMHHRGGGGGDHRFRHRFDERVVEQRGFDHRRFGQTDFGGWGSYDLQSSYDDRDWAPESGNDWWNDRPDRAYPRWVQEQQARGTCDPDRMWWSGSGWHC